MIPGPGVISDPGVPVGEKACSSTPLSRQVISEPPEAVGATCTPSEPAPEVGRIGSLSALPAVT
jgi:hypothetical protein